MKLTTTLKLDAVSFLRKFITPILLAMTCSAASASTVTERLVLQHKIDAEVPLAKATFIGTHNSYNATNWGYPAPNHFKDPTEQLDAGFRVINFDIHTHIDWMSLGRANDILCHFLHDSSLLCSKTDKSLLSAMAELNNWLEENPDEVVLLVLEDFIQDFRYDEVVSTIRDTVGKRVYKPNYQNSVPFCSSLPVHHTTKQDVLDKGKQLIIAAGGKHENCQEISYWDKWVWYLPNVDYKGDKYRAEPIKRFKYKLSFLYEDRLFSDFSSELDGNEIAEALEMGAAVIGLDFALTYDRREHAIWSWDTNEPNNANNEDCTVQRENGKWNDYPCSRNYHYACQSKNDWHWEISDSTGNWQNGNQACQALGEEFFFSMPVNANNNKLLKDEKAANNITQVWLNHNDINNEGQWRSVHIFNYQEQTNTQIGTESNDTFTAEQGDQDFYGYSGTDTVNYGHAVNGIDVRLWAEQAYNDGFGTHDNLFDIENIRGSAHNDYISGSEKNNHLIGDAGNDTLLGGAGNDILAGEDGIDSLHGGEGTDKAGFINAPNGIDVNLVNDIVNSDGYGNTESIFEIENILGSNFNDIIKGSHGDNRLEGDDGDDHIEGKQGQDTLYGGNGNDFLGGGQGNDDLFGGDGNDTLKGAKGNDKLKGGAGADIFVLSTTDGTDSIEDFTWSSGDKIHIDASVFSINSLNELSVIIIDYTGLPHYELKIGNKVLATSILPISVSRDIVLF
jgi:hypothetical protein